MSVLLLIYSVKLIQLEVFNYVSSLVKKFCLVVVTFIQLDNLNEWRWFIFLRYDSRDGRSLFL